MVWIVLPGRERGKRERREVREGCERERGM
jgi:hypothetical protein